MTKPFYNKSNKLNPHKITQKWIDENYPEFNNIDSFTTNIREKIYCLNNKIIEEPLCTCGKKLKFVKTSYRKYCSKECAKLNRKNDSLKGFQNKYGVSNFFGTEEFQEKRKKTSLEKYGVEHHMKNKEIKDKVISKRDEEKSKEKRKKSNLKKYGVKNTFELIEEVWNKGITKADFNDIKTEEHTISQLSELVNTSYSHTARLLRDKNLKYFSDKIEERINEIFNGSFILRTRSIIPPLELDLYSKEHKLAIEYNGMIWHSFGESKYPQFNNLHIEEQNKFNHLRKTELCEEKDIQLFHIFEDEWLDLNKRAIWVSIINKKLCNSDKIIFLKYSDIAKDVYIKEIKEDIANKFHIENNLEGNQIDGTHLGLFYKDEIQQIISFRKSSIIRVSEIKNKVIKSGFDEIINFYEDKLGSGFKNGLEIKLNRRFYSSVPFKGFELISKTKPNKFKLSNDRVIYDSGYLVYKKI